VSRFDDVQAEWSAKYRTPVISDGYANKAYVACLVFPIEGDTLNEIWGIQEPDEADAALLGQYIEFRIASWYNQRWINLMGQKPLDIDPGINTVIFRKTDKGWHYTRASWRTGPPFIPMLNAEKQYSTLLEIMDQERMLGDRPDSKWEAFKEENGLIHVNA